MGDINIEIIRDDRLLDKYSNNEWRAIIIYGNQHVKLSNASLAGLGLAIGHVLKEINQDEEKKWLER